MTRKIGRNEPCVCGSDKKYKHCCLNKNKPGLPRKFKATVLGTKLPQTTQEPAPAQPEVDLIQRTFAPVMDSENPNS